MALETRAARVQALRTEAWLHGSCACDRVHNPRVMRSSDCPPLTPPPSKASANAFAPEWGRKSRGIIAFALQAPSVSESRIAAMIVKGVIACV